MKKQLSLFIRAAAAVGITAIFGGDALAAQTTTVNVHHQVDVRPAAGRTFYTAQQQRGPVAPEAARPVTTTPVTAQPARAATTTAPLNVKHLADPFFQPTTGQIGSVTDIGWTRNSYDFKVDYLPVNFDGSWEARSLFLKQDLSYGITDYLVVIGSVRLGHDEFKMSFVDPAYSSVRNTDSGFNQYGIGLQWKFVDNNEWVGLIGGYYQWQEVANAFILDTKLGYKVQGSTVYGLGRMWGVNWSENSYGNGVTDNSDPLRASLFIAFDRDVDNSVFVEGGVGIFTPLDDQWSFNLEAIYGYYDWHSQLGIFGSINYQPIETFAISLYGRVSAWDSANSGTNFEMWWWDRNTPEALPVGNTKLSGYSDIAFGIKAFMSF